MEAEGSLTATQAKTVLAEMLADGGGDPAAIAAAKGFEAMSEDSLAAAVADVVAAHPDEWARFCDGDEKHRGHSSSARSWRATQGKADGKAVQAELARLRG